LEPSKPGDLQNVIPDDAEVEAEAETEADIIAQIQHQNEKYQQFTICGMAIWPLNKFSK
jgi:hypothetical protein